LSSKFGHRPNFGSLEFRHQNRRQNSTLTSAAGEGGKVRLSVDIQSSGRGNGPIRRVPAIIRPGNNPEARCNPRPGGRLKSGKAR
jgi:hypothetical protein